jgi:hypothetical protein
LNLLSKIEDSTFVFFDNLPIDLYLYEYAKAFILAYSEFETILNQNQTLIADTQEQKALKIFSYVLNAKYKNGYFGGEYENIEELKNKKGMYVTNDDMYDWGYKGGQYYKAWEIILNNPLIFEPLFEKFFVVKTIDKIEIEVANPHPQVFSNLKSFQLFEKLYFQFKDSNNKMADFSFIYRKMYNDAYILNHYKPQMFIGWINKEPYNISLDKIKTLNDCSTSQKVNTYTTTKELMQLT